MKNHVTKAAALLLATSLLSACGSGAKSDPATSAKSAAVAQAIFEKQLTLISTDGSLTSANEFSLPPESANKPFSIRYRFNSGNQNGLKIFRHAQQSRCNGKSPNPVFTLKGASATEKLDLFKTFPLEQNEDYELDVEFKENECSGLIFDLNVWAGDLTPQTDVQLARRCQHAGGSLDFFTNGTFLVYTSKGGSQAYIGNKRVCGVPVQRSSSSGYSFSIGNETILAEYVGVDSARYGFKAELKAEGSLGLVCHKNDQPFAELSFASCEERILDLSQYQ